MVEISIFLDSADNMVLNRTLDVLFAITCGSWNFRRENRIIISLDVFKPFLYIGRALQGEHGVTAMIYPTNISTFVDDNNRQIVTNLASVIFNTQLVAVFVSS